MGKAFDTGPTRFVRSGKPAATQPSGGPQSPLTESSPMSRLTPLTPSWFTFRRVFLWTLAAFALLWSLRADADDRRGPTLITRPASPVINVAPSPEPPPVPADPSPETATEQPVPPPMPEPIPADDIAPAIISPAAVTSDVGGASVTQFENWTVTILPSAPTGATVNGRSYEEVYASIPYSRAEYLANPGYRHEATMEILFGQLRPKTVVSEYTPKVIPTPRFSVYKPSLPSRSSLYRVWRPSLAPYSWNFPLTPYYPSYPALPLYY